jgi:hypothetical protein
VKIDAYAIEAQLAEFYKKYPMLKVSAHSYYDDESRVVIAEYVKLMDNLA